MRTIAATWVALSVGCIASAGTPELGQRERGAAVGAPLDRGEPVETRAAITPAPPVEQRITLAFGGDVHGESSIRHALAAGTNPFAGIAAPLRSADLALVNLETTVGRRGTPQPRRFSFRAPVSLLDAAVDSGIDVVSLGNNHAWDYGPTGLLATLQHVHEAGLVAVGAAAKRDSAFTPALVDVEGVRIAVLGFSRVGTDWRTRAGDDRPGTTDGFDLARSTAAIRRAALAAELVVVTVHMGAERHACPTASDRTFVERALDAGAAIVVGHHPHVLQGIEQRDGKLAAYSLGNLVFDAQGPKSRTTGILTVVADADGRVVDHAFAPARIVDDLPVLLEGDARASVLAELAAIGPEGDRCSGWGDHT